MLTFVTGTFVSKVTKVSLGLVTVSALVVVSLVGVRFLNEIFSFKMFAKPLRLVTKVSRVQ